MTESLYPVVAGNVYFGSLVVACPTALWFATRHPIHPFTPVIRNMGIAVVGGILVSCALALVGIVLGSVDRGSAALVFQQWVIALLAIMTVPWGLAHAHEVTEAWWQAHPGRKRRRVVEAGILGASAVIAFSVAYMLLTERTGQEPRTGEVLSKGFATPLSSIAFGILGLVAAVLEELTIRLGVQGVLERLLRRVPGCTWWAIGLASIFWALGHASNTTIPGWKEVQILVLGVFLGTLRVRYGVGATIIAHFSLNAFILVASCLLELKK